MSRLERLDERYRRHHRTEQTPGFVFAAPERSELFRRSVGGPGRRVLDLGCRDGALTRAYLAGNKVVGVDVDRHALGEAAELGIETVWADVEEPLLLAGFDEPGLEYVAGRFLRLHPRLLANVIVFSATKPV